MKLYTFEDFAVGLRHPMSLSAVKRNLMLNDEVPFIPNFVVDEWDARSTHQYIMQPLAEYGLIFQKPVHMAPDRTTVYFIDQEDAMLFILAAG